MDLPHSHSGACTTATNGPLPFNNPSRAAPVRTLLKVESVCADRFRTISRKARHKPTSDLPPDLSKALHSRFVRDQCIGHAFRPSGAVLVGTVISPTLGKRICSCPNCPPPRQALGTLDRSRNARPEGIRQGRSKGRMTLMRGRMLATPEGWYIVHFRHDYCYVWLQTQRAFVCRRQKDMRPTVASSRYIHDMTTSMQTGLTLHLVI